MEDLKQLMQSHFRQYASYVILDRAIPNVVDGLKPVQRRILYTLFLQRDDKLHKVANMVGQTMAFHPHGDAPIYEALVNMANKGYLLDRQGNFGNIFTGDPSAAARYIETRLSPLARATLFNPDLTRYIPTYDGRTEEPLVLPAKIPLILMQGVDGIAVGMATHILPHNFVELLEAEIAYLEGRDFSIVPDFPTGGIMDASEYDHGRGKVKLRAKIDIKDPKTLVIREICYGTTTESLIRSIDEAAKKGKIKIESIDDYTAQNVEIEIKLPRGVYAEELIDALYAFTECQVSLTSQVIMVKDQMPWETDVKQVLQFHAEKLQEYLRRELEIEKGRLEEKVFLKSLEQIFIEQKIYKKIETMKTYEDVHRAVADGLEPFHSQLSRVPQAEDREKLLGLPIRRISQFDREKNQKEIEDSLAAIREIDKHLKQVKKYTIKYLKDLIKQFGGDFPRKTVNASIEELDIKAIATKQIKVGVDYEGGFLGTKVASSDMIECTNFDKLLLMTKGGSYKVINIPEKQYVGGEGDELVYAGAADKKTVISVVYKNPKTRHVYGKRFVIEKFILDKPYRFLEEGMTLEHFTLSPEPKIQLIFSPKPKQRCAEASFSLTDVLVKGVSAKGVRLSPREVRKINVLNK